ncbi:hypothetical protein Pan258_22310 [Symmachiella dynata]|nr:hypothetical protein Pan258_22310 [Symmachiella dynata]|tara:strand:- start:978 stop:1322 length:345 start_codon:yes stop_codon:yes gene_type:complete
MGDNSEQTNAPSGCRSVFVNLVLIPAGMILGYTWSLLWFALGDAVGLRGRIFVREWAMRSGQNDFQLAGAIVGLSIVLLVAGHVFSWWPWGWRRLGFSVGLLVGLVLSFVALAK